MKSVAIYGAILLLIAVLIPIGVNNLIKDEKITEENFVVILDTGKSDCIVIKENEKVIVIDTAEEEDYNKIKNFLDVQEINKIDYLIITHFDKDHVGGASKLINDYKVLNVIEADYIKESEYVDNYRDALEKNNNNLSVLKSELVLKFDDMILRLNPTNLKDASSNNNSIIADLFIDNKNILFMGDAEEERIAEFLKHNNNNINYDFVKMPHHGSYNNNLEDLLNFTTPKAVGITCSNKNPADDKTLELLQENNIETYLTSNGNISILDIINN